MTRILRKRLAVTGAVLLWGAVIAFGTHTFWSYAEVPGKLEKAPVDWPDEAGALEPGKAALVLFLHPECPCSRATVAELNRLLTRTPPNLQVTLYFLQPADEQWSAEASGLWRTAARLPGVKLQRDVDGQFARIFSAETSGTVRFYDAHGKLRFSGGITGARGQEGDNPGEEMLLTTLHNPDTPAAITHVFGCSLF